MKHCLLTILLFSFISCNKQSAFKSSKLSNQKTFTYSIDPFNWIDYPYIGHDGDTTENRMFFQAERVLLDAAYYRGPESIKWVEVKKRDREIVAAPRWISVGPNDKGYVYAIGNAGIANQLTLWWIQKPPYTEQPDAESMVICLQ